MKSCNGKYMSSASCMMASCPGGESQHLQFSTSNPASATPASSLSGAFPRTSSRAALRVSIHMKDLAS